MKKPKKIMALVLAIATVAALAVGTFAFFTDRIQAQATATAGTLELALTDIATGDNTKMKPAPAAPWTLLCPIWATSPQTSRRSWSFVLPSP